MEITLTVAKELEDLRTSVPGCSLVIFGDLFSQVTLCVSARSRHKQEQLDAICVTAGNLLDGAAAQSASSALGFPEGTGISQAVILSPDEVQIFLRSPFEEADVLCCVGSSSLDIDQTNTEAHSAFLHISKSQ